MVVSSQALASRVGADILAAGGNAVDAAVAVAFAEAVVNPCCGNLGGGGFLVLHTADGGSRFVNFRETAPGAATRDMYLDGAGNVVKGASLKGWKAAGSPARCSASPPRSPATAPCRWPGSSPPRSPSPGTASS